MARGERLRFGDLFERGCLASSEPDLSSECGRLGDFILPPLDAGGLARWTAARAADASDPVEVGLATRLSFVPLVKDEARDRVCAWS